MKKAIIAGTSIEDIIDKPFKTYTTDYGDVDAALDGDFLFILRETGIGKVPKYAEKMHEGHVSSQRMQLVPLRSAFFLRK